METSAGRRAGSGDGRTGTVTAVRPAAPEVARAHFARLLELETDCADVAADLAAGTADFVLLDVRSPAAYAAGHVEGARNCRTARSRWTRWPTSRRRRPASCTARDPTATAPTGRRWRWRGWDDR